MKITRKETRFDEAMLNDMYAERLLEKYYKMKYESGATEEFLTLAVWVDKDTGVDHMYDMCTFENYGECREDDKLNRSLFNSRCNCYRLYITGKRIAFLKDKPIFVVIEAEAIEG